MCIRDRNNYHKEKREKFLKEGISIYQIFEDEWRDKKEIVKSVIRSKLNIYENIYYARKLDIKEVSLDEERKFLNENHLQGYVASTICLGLYNGEELISLMSFGRSRFNKIYKWELLRFVNKIGCRVVAGASRLFKNFIKENNPESIISYCDLRVFDGELYKNLGFNFLHNSAPNYYYIVDGNRHSRMKYQKHKLKDKFPSIFSEEKTEKIIMEEAGYYPIYDCGMGAWKIVF